MANTSFISKVAGVANTSFISHTAVPGVLRPCPAECTAPGVWNVGDACDTISVASVQYGSNRLRLRNAFRGSRALNCGAVRMYACHGLEQEGTQRDVTANPKRLPFNTLPLGARFTPASVRSVTPSLGPQPASAQRGRPQALLKDRGTVPSKTHYPLREEGVEGGGTRLFTTPRSW